MCDWLAEEEPEEVASGGPDEDAPTCFTVGEYGDTDRACEEVKEHACESELWTQCHRGQKYDERLECDGDPEGRGWDRDLCADGGEQCEEGYR